MGIQSHISHSEAEGPPHTHIITLHVAFDAGPGGAGQTDVNVSILWDPARFALTGTPSPGGGVHSPGSGLVVWGGVTVDDVGTDFVAGLRCIGTVKGVSEVTGVAEEVGTSARPTRYKVSITC